MSLEWLQNALDVVRAGDTSTSPPVETIMLSLLMAFVIGQIIAWIYMATHATPSYSSSFVASLVVLPVIVSLMMILMAGSLMIAFGLLAVFAVSGFGAGFLNPVIGAVLIERVPRRLLGRVNALGDSLAWAGTPLGGLIAGAVVSSTGLVPVLLVCGAVYFLITSLAGLRPEWREMDRRTGKNVARWHPEKTAPHPNQEATS